MVNVNTGLKTSMDDMYTSPLAVKTGKSELAGEGAAASNSGPTSDAAADFRALFTSRSNPPTTVAPTAPPVVITAQSMFGPNPWVLNPGGVAPNGVTYGYNPAYFATRETADTLAKIYGGTVEETNAITPYGPFKQNQLNEMIRFPNGNVVNAGILASYFDRGFSREQIDRSIAVEINDLRK